MLTDNFYILRIQQNVRILKKSELDWTDLVCKERQYTDV